MAEKQSSTALVFCYYWPPSSGGGVMRWFKMAKYWHEFGGKLIVVTPDVSDYPAYDESLLDEIPHDLEVIKLPIWEPYGWYKRFMGKKTNVYSGFLNEEKKGWKSRFAVWIRSNFFIPDARKFWIRPTARYMTKYLKTHPVDCIITSGTPHSLHLIGLQLKKATGLPWIADFRDPWTDIDYADQLSLTPWARARHHHLEKEVLSRADHVVTVSWAWQKLLAGISGKDNVSVITNGYDPADFVQFRARRPEKFTFIHLGSMNANRNPKMFWQALAELCAEERISDDELEIVLIGQVDQAIVEDYTAQGLASNVKKLPFMPHQQGLKVLETASVLLLLVSQWDKASGMIPGKTYEYLATGKPILSLGHTAADVAHVLSSHEDAVHLSYEDLKAIKSYIIHQYDLFKNHTHEPPAASIDQYSRRSLAQKYQELIHTIS